MADITFATPISELVVGVKAGNISAHDLVSASLEKIESAKEYHAILETNPEALAQAIAIDKRIEAGEILPLAGIPFIAKDNFLTFNTHTTASSNILAPFRAPYQSVAVERLEAAGAIMVAKANLDAFAHGSSTENSDFGPTKNPHDITRVPGGSSGGSAAAVALGLASFALGTDTGGSIRLPASYCGVVGFKPTYGLIPRTGVIAMGSSTDVIGPITNSVSDAAIVLDVLAGKSESDSTSIDRIEGSYIVEKSQDLKGKSFGLIKEYLEEGINPEIKAQVLGLVDQIKARGAEVHEISLPATKLALAAYYILVPAEVSSNLARYDGVRFGHSSKVATDLEETYRLSREEGFGDEAKRRILIGTYVLSSGYYDAYYKRAQIVRTKLIQEFDAAFSKYDYLIGPTGPTVAFKLGANTEDILAMYLNDVMTVAVNLVGNAAISLPLGTQEKLPFGVQIISPQRTEKDLLGIAAEVETIIGDWRKR
jgi:aspartyl-tRNA(Asn)/glutamyl-tRNA(Gln) amidotransferase subunit A